MGGAQRLSKNFVLRADYEAQAKFGRILAWKCGTAAFRQEIMAETAFSSKSAQYVRSTHPTALHPLCRRELANFGNRFDLQRGVVDIEAVRELLADPVQ